MLEAAVAAHIGADQRRLGLGGQPRQSLPGPDRGVQHVVGLQAAGGLDGQLLGLPVGQHQGADGRVQQLGGRVEHPLERCCEVEGGGESPRYLEEVPQLVEVAHDVLVEEGALQGQGGLIGIGG